MRFYVRVIVWFCVGVYATGIRYFTFCCLLFLFLFSFNLLFPGPLSPIFVVKGLLYFLLSYPFANSVSPLCGLPRMHLDLVLLFLFCFVFVAHLSHLRIMSLLPIS